VAGFEVDSNFDIKTITEGRLNSMTRFGAAETKSDFEKANLQVKDHFSWRKEMVLPYLPQQT
jgi:hypothetical protein